MNTTDKAEMRSWPVWAREEYEERAGIRQYDGGQTRAEAEQGAFLDVQQRLTTHPTGGTR